MGENSNIDGIIASYCSDLLSFVYMDSDVSASCFISNQNVIVMLTHTKINNSWPTSGLVPSTPERDWENSTKVTISL